MDLCNAAPVSLLQYLMFLTMRESRRCKREAGRFSGVEPEQRSDSDGALVKVGKSRALVVAGSGVYMFVTSALASASAY